MCFFFLFVKPSAAMAGLVPAIHVFNRGKDADTRNKPEDDSENAFSE
jgi:hypothetical protein